MTFCLRKGSTGIARRRAQYGLPLVVLSFLTVTVASAAENGDFVKFVRANADKFKVEIVESDAIKVGTRVRLRGALDPIDLVPILPEYNSDFGGVVATSPITLAFMLSSICKPAGSFTGQNAFGAKAAVRRERCERFFVWDNDPMGAKQLVGERLLMSPAQYRQVKKSGVQIEIDFVLGYPSKGPLVEVGEGVEEATTSHPVQTQFRIWTAYGRVEEVHWLLPGSAAVSKAWTRGQ